MGGAHSHAVCVKNNTPTTHPQWNPWIKCAPPDDITLVLTHHSHTAITAKALDPVSKYEDR